jgi:hypothetical protein
VGEPHDSSDKFSNAVNQITRIRYSFHSEWSIHAPESDNSDLEDAYSEHSECDNSESNSDNSKSDSNNSGSKSDNAESDSDNFDLNLWV